MKENRTAIVIWLWSGIVLVVLMVAVGGATRLTGSGLSMVKWQVISGTIPPLTTEKWNEVFHAYQQFPEYQKLNYHLTLSDFKSIFWWEYSHRLLGRITGLVFIIPFMYFLFRGYLSRPLIRKLTFILLLGMLQGAMGWIMVKSGLVDNPHVSHYRLAMHLSLALLLIGSMLWLVLELRAGHFRRPEVHHVRLSLPVACLSVIFIQMVLGAFVAGLKAGYYYNTYPLMNDQFLPREALSYSSRIFDNGIFVQFLHRWFAWIVAGGVFSLWLKVRLGYFNRKIRVLSGYLLAATTIQVLLGITTLIWSVPLILGMLHQLMAVLLFGLTVAVLYQMKYSSSFSFTSIVKGPF